MGTTVQFEAKQTYYLWASRKAEEAIFKSKIDEAIWKFHAEGVKCKEMADDIGLNGSYISRKLRKIEDYIRNQTDMVIASISFNQAVCR